MTFIIFSSLCIISACTTHEEYSQSIGRLTNYLKPGGKLILQSLKAQGKYYYVGSETFFTLSVTPEFLNSTLSEKGYKDISITVQPCEGTSGADIALSMCTPSSVDATLFVVATKK